MRNYSLARGYQALAFNAADLDRLFEEAQEADRSDFAEMRTSLLMVSGEHYNKKGARFFDRIRSSKDLTQETKVRLTKNHLGRIARQYSNIITSAAPGVHVKPKHEREIQDQKSAELNQAVWVDGKERNNLSVQIPDWVDDFAWIGEVWAKLSFNPLAGPMIPGQPTLDPMTGMPVQGAPRPQGQLVIEPIYAFNLLCDPAAKHVGRANWYCERKMVSTENLKQQFPQFADKIAEVDDDTFMIFDANGYRQSKKGETLLREWYFKPGPKYPQGYYVLQIPGCVLDEGELPGGLFPIVGERFEYVQTKRRGIACTKPLRPYQIEINRAASKIAEHQLTLGDDKLVLQNGATVSAGVTLPGIRTVKVTGQAPTIMEGRAGSQYGDYMLTTIKEMYQVAEIEDDQEMPANMEPHTLLFRAAKQKRRFSRYIGRIEGFLKSLCERYLEFAHYYLDDEAVIMAVGRNERINVAEFKRTETAALSFVVEPQAEDIETKLGRQLVMTSIIQYVGQNLDSASIGKLIKQMPYANVDESFSDLTLDYECATNDILALDRGETPLVNTYDNHEYIIKRLDARRKQGDFRFLHPYIQENYQRVIDEHISIMDQQKQAMQRAQSGFIPDGGAMIGVDYFVQDPNNPERTRRARMPYAAIDWLYKKLQEQGAMTEVMAQMPDDIIMRSEQLSPTIPQADPLQQLVASDIPTAGGSSAEVVPPGNTIN